MAIDNSYLVTTQQFQWDCAVHVKPSDSKVLPITCASVANMAQNVVDFVMPSIGESICHCTIVFAHGKGWDWRRSCERRWQGTHLKDAASGLYNQARYCIHCITHKTPLGACFYSQGIMLFKPPLLGMTARTCECFLDQPLALPYLC